MSRTASCRIENETGRPLNRLVVIAAIVAIAASIVRSDDAASSTGRMPGLRQEMKPFFQGHCLDCHRGDDPEGGFSLDSLGDDPSSSRDVAKQWQTVSQSLILGEMPPEGEPRPGRTSSIR